MRCARALLLFLFMRYHHVAAPSGRFAGEIYICDHPAYNRCTLYRSGPRGLAVIQQRLRPGTKETYWTELDMGLSRDIYEHPDFPRYFEARAGRPLGDLYPTVTVRQIMWALRMKPLPKARWETVFDRRDI